ncbi:LysR family transcriptional regulator [Lactobacillus pasteurii]|uniref:Malolactic regulator n=1 Tax=Lactobacillus pasteurii DSM 23907 = CRBIP 24.76 TaxID=1423790 RepID=I7JXG7_9LACO|nr:LysR family transcriptional regulator [Lactobacillus pasteurii]TDG77128.1 hypothetical protein C5L33_000321 [Lactobacillus pasteurii]CCI84610.1 Malolactic regulator [Lactobacillus pasteurii DSM 23907 = CRBIP 24.76]
MNIQDFRYYHDLVKEKSYTKTAKKFGVSQPTITAAINRLEEQFGGQFLIRDQSHKSIIITHLGMQFDEHIQTILKEIEIAKLEIQRNSASKISFGLPPIIGQNYFPKLVPELLHTGILKNLEVIEAGSNDLIDLLIHGEINFSLLGLTDPNLAFGIDAKIIAHYPLRIIVAKNHPWASREGLYFRELADQDFIGLSSNYIHNQLLTQMLKQNQININTIYRSPDVAVVKSLVAKNLGISYLTSLAIDENDQVVALPLLDSNQPDFILAAVSRQNHLMTSKEEQLWNILSKQAVN